MKLWSRMLVATSGMLLSFSMFGYELATHAAITYSAMLRSTVVGQGVLLGLGVSPSSSTPIALEYFDRMGTDIRRRAAFNFDYDLKKMPLVDVNSVQVT